MNELFERFKAIEIHEFMIACMLIVVAAAFATGSAAFAPQVAVCVATAGLLDYCINRFAKKKDHLPKSGVITGFLVSFVLGPTPLAVAAAVAIIAILSKHVIARGFFHPFNPAAFGLVAGTLLLRTTDAWWAGASPVVIPLALMVSWKLGKLPLTFSFLVASALLGGFYFGFASLASLQGIINAFGFMFFAGFMLVEPVTSTYLPKAMVVEGVLVAAFGWAIVFLLPGVAAATDALLVALLLGNLLVPVLNERLA